MISKDTDYLKSIMPDHVTHITGRVQSIDARIYGSRSDFLE